jgi:hypothetical protein
MPVYDFASVGVSEMFQKSLHSPNPSPAEEAREIACRPFVRV